MKKLLSILLSLTMIVCFAACGQKEEAKGPGCYVTIVDKGSFVASAMFVELPNKDADNTLDDVLKATFKALGKEADYASAQTDYGLSLTNLCGDTSGSYGYYVNNESGFMDLSPIVKENDYVVAFVYADQAAWSDSYAYFDKFMAEGSEISLTLTKTGFDENWNTVKLACENAVITIDGKDTEFKTDKDGKVSVKINEKGEHLISAKQDGFVLVNPVCILTVK